MLDELRYEWLTTILISSELLNEFWYSIYECCSIDDTELSNTAVCLRSKNPSIFFIFNSKDFKNWILANVNWFDVFSLNELVTLGVFAFSDLTDL